MRHFLPGTTIPCLTALSESLTPRQKLMNTLAIVLLLVLVLPAAAQGGTMSNRARPATWVPNGAVYAIATTPDTVYIGGNFNHVGPFTGSGVPLSPTTGQPLESFPKVLGHVYESISDGAGGLFICGRFFEVGGVPRKGLAHLLPDGSLDTAWDAGCDGSVFRMALSDEGILYIAGGFSQVGGKDRIQLAALDATTGNVTDWNHALQGNAFDLNLFTVAGESVYVGATPEAFESPDDYRAILILDAHTGARTDLSCKFTGSIGNDPVKSLAIVGNTLYMSGRIRIDGTDYGLLAAYDLNTGSMLNWQPYPYTFGSKATVDGLQVQDSKLYFWQHDTYVRYSRHRFMMLNSPTGALTELYSFESDGWTWGFSQGDTLYLRGWFSRINSEKRRGLAAVNLTTKTLLPWNPRLSDPPSTLNFIGDNLFAGGQFTSVGGVDRNYLAALDVKTGTATEWDPSHDEHKGFDGSNGYYKVLALALSGSTVYVGGEFKSIGNQLRDYLAAFDATTGDIKSWNPGPTEPVYTLAASDSTVYVGGKFQIIAGQVRRRVAAFDTATGALKTWNPNVSASVYALALSGSNLYLGGDFTQVGNQARTGVAAVDAVTGLPTAWNPGVQSSISSLVVSGNRVFMGSSDRAIPNIPITNRVTVLDATTAETIWQFASVNNYALAVAGPALYVGGLHFYGSFPFKSDVAFALDTTAQTLLPWKPDFAVDLIAYGQYTTPLTTIPTAMATVGSKLYVGGPFNLVHGEGRPCFAEFDVAPAAPETLGATDETETAITWTWEDKADNEEGFKLYADPGSAAPVTLRDTLPADTDSWTQAGLVPNTAYTFSVHATSFAGDGSPATPYTARTALQPVTAITFEAVSSDTISVSPAGVFTNLADADSGVLLENVTTGADAGWQQNRNPASFTGLSPNTAYTFRGRSRNGLGIETTPFSASKYTLAALPAPPVLSAPTSHSLTVEIGAGDPNPSDTRYAIAISPAGSGGTWVQAGGILGATPYFQTAAAWGATSVSGLNASTPYAVRVTARNAEDIDTLPGPETIETTVKQDLPEDLNGDGLVNATDVQTVINAALRDRQSAAFDVTGDNKVDAADVQTVINSVLRGGR